MGKSELKTQAKEFIENNRAGSLATADKKGEPHVAVVFCFAEDDLAIYFTCRVESRKFKNILVRPEVALTFYDEANLITLQLSGTAVRVENIEEEQKILQKLFTLRLNERNWPTPVVKMYESGATNEIAVLKVTPTEMTLSNFETQPDGRYKSFYHTII